MRMRHLVHCLYGNFGRKFVGGSARLHFQRPGGFNCRPKECLRLGRPDQAHQVRHAQRHRGIARGRELAFKHPQNRLRVIHRGQDRVVQRLKNRPKLVTGGWAAALFCQHIQRLQVLRPPGRILCQRVGDQAKAQLTLLAVPGLRWRARFHCLFQFGPRCRPRQHVHDFVKLKRSDCPKAAAH